MTDTYLTVKWTVSRGINTYGYNICTLTDTDTGKKYRATGGGYDMLGTVFGEWLQEVHADKLQTIRDSAHTVYHRATDGSYDHSATERFDAGLYGMSTIYTAKMTSATVRLDGACGLESMKRIAEAVGLNVRSLVNRKGNVEGFIVSDSR